MLEYIKATGISYANELKVIKKSGIQLQPVYEAFSNAWESLQERFPKEHMNLGRIRMEFHYSVGMFGDDEQNRTTILTKIVIIDNGVGIDPKSYDRLKTLRDSSKSARSKGTGRIQFAHYFDDTIFDSIYRRDEHKGKHLIVRLSKKEAFLANNAILRKELEEDVIDRNTYTKVILNRLLDERKDGRFYNELPLDAVASELNRHFLARLCESRDYLPKIELFRFEDGNETRKLEIKATDIPTPDKSEIITVKYSKLDNSNKVVDADREETFNMLSFVQPKDVLSQNSIYYVSNGALAQENNVDGLQKKDSIDGNRYMFLLSGSYFDGVDDDLRGNLHLVRESEFKKQNEGNLFPEECLLVDNIEQQTNAKIAETYPQFVEKKEAAQKNLDELQSMFLLDEEAITSFRKNVKSSDTDADILSHIYKSEMDATAKRDAELKAEYEKLKTLKPDKKDYQQQLKDRVEAFTKLIPLQNRTSLTKYVARRKLVLEVFRIIMENAKKIGAINEDVLHNLIFRQKIENRRPDDNDMWLLNDEYIYFSGTSDIKLRKIEIQGKKLIKENLSAEEEEYLVKASHDGGNRRPDIFLFPREGRCIIVEFKAPDIDVSNHLHQINRYARLINNLSDSSFCFCRYYGYLIGENVDIEEIKDSDPYFQDAPNLDYIFKPYLPIKGKFGRKDGSLYTEIIKYSDILARALHRNQIFVDKLDSKI